LADSWTLWLRLYAPSRSYALPNLLFTLASLLLPLAGLLQYRMLRRPMVVEGGLLQRQRSDMHHDLRTCLRLLLPFVVALLAGVALETKILLAPNPASGDVVPRLLILLLLLLALARQAVGILDYLHVQRERDIEQANAHVWRETTRQMETYLGIVSHELKPPLTSLQGNIALMARRLRRVPLDQGEAVETKDLIPLMTTVRTLVEG